MGQDPPSSSHSRLANSIEAEPSWRIRVVAEAEATGLRLRGWLGWGILGLLLTVVGILVTWGLAKGWF